MRRGAGVGNRKAMLPGTDHTEDGVGARGVVRGFIHKAPSGFLHDPEALRCRTVLIELPGAPPPFFVSAGFRHAVDVLHVDHPGADI